MSLERRENPLGSGGGRRGELKLRKSCLCPQHKVSFLLLLLLVHWKALKNPVSLFALPATNGDLSAKKRGASLVLLLRAIRPPPPPLFEAVAKRERKIRIPSACAKTFFSGGGVEVEEEEEDSSSLSFCSRFRSRSVFTCGDSRQVK